MTCAPVRRSRGDADEGTVLAFLRFYGRERSLDARCPDRPLYPADARRYAEVRDWERTADTLLDAIVTVIGNWQFANLPPMPAGLQAAARRDIGAVYDRLQ